MKNTVFCGKKTPGIYYALPLMGVFLTALLMVMVSSQAYTNEANLRNEGSIGITPLEASALIQPNQNTLEISGRVTDATGLSLPGVSVLVKGTTLGTVTDINGLYRIVVPAQAEILIFSFIGMKSTEEIIAGRTVIDIFLESESIGLDEIVVVGYGSQRKINLTGSVSTVRSEDLVKVPSANVSEVLIGKAPGLFSKQSQGVPGADNTNLSIRGFGAALILVDGIESSWTRLDPNEIESVSILKDAAAAIYGARAGNGVILITTKRGTNSKPTISYSSNYSFQDPTTVPEFVSSWKYAEMLREGQFNSNLPYTYSEEDVQKFKAGTDPDFVNQDWYDATFISWAPMQSHNLGVRGGTDNIKYYLTVGYLDQSSIYRSGDLSFNRYNARSNVDAQINDRLSASLDISFRNEIRKSPQADLANIWNSLKTALPVYSANLPDPTKGGAYSGFLVRSPYAQTVRDHAGFTDDIQRYITGKLALKYQIPGIKGLEANATLNYYINNMYDKTQNKPFEVFTYDNANDEYLSWGLNGANTLRENFSQYRQIYPMLSLNYENTFGDHYFQGLLLGEAINTDYFYMFAGRVDLLSLDIPFLFAGSPENLTNGGSASSTGRVSTVGRGNYIYKGKYMFETTFRLDASHKFAPESRWGFFPSVSAAWRLSEESFIKDHLSWVDNIKLRASYSQAGNDNVAAFKYLTGYNILGAANSIYMFGNDVFRLIRSSGLPNPDITWLDMTTYNAGLDASFMKDLIGFELDVFYRITDNIFGQPLGTYPSTFGATLPQVNLNSTDNRGFEFTLNHRNKIGRDFDYRISGMVSYAREKYRRWSESPYEDPDEIRIYKNTGNYTNRWIGYLSDGLFMNLEEIQNHPVDQDQAGNSTLRPGDIRYKDLNDDGVIDWRDQDVIGYGTFPDLTYGFDLGFQYKNFGVSALFQGASRFNSMIVDVLRGPLQNLGNPFEFQYKYRWQPDPNNPGVNINPDAQLPAIVGDGVGTNVNNNKASDFWLKDGTYLRLRNLNISYTIPNNVTNKVGLQKVNVFMAGSNLFTWSKLGIYKESVDPETTQGVKFYPPVKTISFGLNVTM